MTDTTTTERTDWMTLREIQELLGISATTVYVLARRNELPVPVIKVGRQYRFSRHAYKNLMSLQHGANQDAG